MQEDRSAESATPEHRKLLKTSVPGVFRRGSRYVAITRHKGKRVKSYHRTMTEAKEAKAARDSGQRPTSREPFERYAERWLDQYDGRNAGGLAPSTRESYAYMMRAFVIPFFRGTKLGDVDRPQVKRFIAHLSTVEPKRAPAGVTRLSPATIRRIVAPLKALLSEAYEDGVVTTDAARVRVVVRDREGRQVKKEVTTMTPEQVAAVLAEIPEGDRVLFLFLARTGVRIGEALGAKWGDLVMADDGPVLQIKRQMYKGVLHERTKTEAGARSVGIKPSLMRDLMRHRDSSSYSADTEPIFATATGQHADAHNVRSRVLRPAATRAGLPWITPHVFRHSLARTMRENGYTDDQIARVLGHSDPNFTRKTYGRTRDVVRLDDLDDALIVAAE